VTVVKIQHAQFMYYVEVPYTAPDGEDSTRLSRRIAMHGDIVDIPRDEDVSRGEELGAFTDDEDLEVPDDAAEDADAANAEEAAGTPDINANHDELVNWIQKSKPNEDAMVNAAQGDPAMAQALMDAEDEASGSQPRKGVINRLQAIVDNSARE
jgi:hypothetical protein